MADLMHNPDKHEAPEAGVTPEPQGMPWWKSKAAIWGLLALLVALGLLFWAFHLPQLPVGPGVPYNRPLHRQKVDQVHPQGRGAPGAPGVHPDPGPPGGLRPHPRGSHRLHRRLPVRGAPGPVVLHPRPDPGLGGGLSHRPLAGRALRQPAGFRRKSSRNSIS